MIPRMIVAVMFCALAMNAIPIRASFAAWQTSPTCVLASNDFVYKVAAASDAADGAIVAYEIADSLTGSIHALRALHLFADGTRDPAWPANGVSLSNFTGVARGDVGAIEDTSGGAYVWWLEGVSLYLTRVSSDGVVPATWPARGRLIATLPAANQRPQAFADGAGGIYLGWLGRPNASDPPRGRIIRIGPGNSGNGGWPNAPRSYAIPDITAGQMILQFAFCPAASGGVWVAWGDLIWDGTQFLPGLWRLTRQTNTGFDPEWTEQGRAVGEFLSHNLSRPFAPTHRLVALADAGDGGVYVLEHEPGASPYMGGDGARIHRFSADSSRPEPWTAEGFPVGYTGFGLPEGGNWENSLDLLPASGGGAFAFAPGFFSDGGPMVWVARVEPTATYQVWEGIENAGGHEELSRPDGVLYLSSFCPNGPYGPYSPPAWLSVSRYGADGAWAGGASEWHPEPVIGWYGDIALARSGRNGAIFFWSQFNSLHGIYARRFVADDEYAGVGEGASAPAALRVRFVPGLGVVAGGSIAPGTRVTIHDVSGRRVLAVDAPASGAGEFVLPGSRELSPGVYFVRAQARDGVPPTAKVVVWR